MSKNAVIYCRTSGNDTLRGSMQDQERDCLIYCKEKGYTVIETVKENIKGQSGADWDAPGITKCIDMAEDNLYDVLVCYSIDRLSRKMAKLYYIERKLQTVNIDIEYVLEDFDDSPESRINKAIKAAIADYERLIVARRLLRGRRKNARRGQVVPCGRVAYGLKVVFMLGGKEYDEQIEGSIPHLMHSEHAYVVKRIFEQYADNISVRQIAKRLQEEGIPSWGDLYPTKAGRQKKTPGHWNYRSINKILGNRVYMGVWEFSEYQKVNRETEGATRNADGVYYVKGARKRKDGKYYLKTITHTVDVPAIVSRELWQKAQERKAQQRYRGKRKSSGKYLLTGHVRCCCGMAMNGSTLTVRGKKYMYYRCSGERNTQGHGRTCKRKALRCDKVENLVTDNILRWLSRPHEVIDILEAQAERAQEDNSGIVERLEYLDQSIAEQESIKARIVKLMIRDSITEQEGKTEKSLAQKVIDDNQKERDRLMAKIDAQPDLEGIKARYLHAIERYLVGEVMTDEKYTMQELDMQKIMADWHMVVTVHDDRIVISSVVGDSAFATDSTAINGKAKYMQRPIEFSVTIPL